MLGKQNKIITKNSEKHQVRQLFEIETRGHDPSASPPFQGKMEASELLGAINTNLSHEYGRRDLALLKRVSEEMRCGSSEGNIKTGS